ncbi:MAG TPA: SCO family protein [Woeseiaceae bacterium]|nr:SCO family protein [Woeseiaceae bacterium]
MQRSITLLALLFGALPAVATEAAELKAGVFEPARPAPEFSLPASDGSDLNLKRFRGKAVVLGFGFTSCPDVCPVTLAILAQARRKLGELADDLQVVYITVDPERDDAEQIRTYLAAFDPTFIGGTGTDAQLAAVREEYGIIAKKQVEGDNYTFAHSSYTYLIDRDGKLRALMTYGHSADDFAHDIRILLQE